MNMRIHKTCTTNTFHTKIIYTTLLVLMLSIGNSWARSDTKTGFDQTDMAKGNIDSFHENNIIVINDMIFFIDKNTKYFTLSGNRVSKGQLNEGDIVSFLSSKEQLLKEVYVMQQTEPKKATISPALQPSSQDMYLENGVWKNQPKQQ